MWERLVNAKFKSIIYFFLNFITEMWEHKVPNVLMLKHDLLHGKLTESIGILIRLKYMRHVATLWRIEPVHGDLRLLSELCLSFGSMANRCLRFFFSLPNWLRNDNDPWINDHTVTSYLLLFRREKKNRFLSFLPIQQYSQQRPHMCQRQHYIRQSDIEQQVAVKVSSCRNKR